MDFSDLQGGVSHCVEEMLKSVDEAGDANNCENAVVDVSEERRGSLAKRRAETCGFSGEKIRLSSSNDSVSYSNPYITISPGISPSALFDCSVLLPNSQVSSSFELVQSNNNPGCRPDLEPKMDLEFQEELSKEVASAADRTTDSVSKLCYTNEKSIQSLAADEVEMIHNSKYNKRSIDLPAAAVKMSEDGYNWKKYGQKQVKGSESPRSYYKCTHAKCLAKKKVERSVDGHITEIIYRGAHNHQKIHPDHQTPYSFEESEAREGIACAQVESMNAQSGFKDVEGLETTSSSYKRINLSDPTLSGLKRKSIDSDQVETLPLSSDAKEGENEDYCGDNEDSETKRRCTENSLIESSVMASSRSLREPKIVVQIETKTDILEDGYRWRKYGQKVVKGNPNPRSYYRCTSPGCSVRKHVERASHDSKYVLTSYEGKHNHLLPSPRNSNHVSPSPGTKLLNSNGSQQAFCSYPRNRNTIKPELEFDEINPFLDMETNFSHSSPGFFSANPFYKMNFPPIPNSLLYNSYAMNSNRASTSQQVGPVPSILPDFQVSLPLSLSSGFEFNRSGNPVLPFQSMNDNDDIKFLRPKMEQKLDDPYCWLH